MIFDSFIPLSVTLTLFQGQRYAAEFRLKVCGVSACLDALTCGQGPNAFQGPYDTFSGVATAERS